VAVGVRATFIVTTALVDVDANKSIPRIAGIASASVAAVCVHALGIPVTVIHAFTLVDISTLLAISLVAGVATARETTRCVCASCVWGAIVAPIRAFVDIQTKMAIARIPWAACASVATGNVQALSIVAA
jgi:hypothetical protein